jgi:hypothetical protein
MNEKVTASVVGRWAHDRLFLRIAGVPRELSLADALVEAEAVPAPGTTICAEVGEEGKIVAWELLDRP